MTNTDTTATHAALRLHTTDALRRLADDPATPVITAVKARAVIDERARRTPRSR
jgi:hypothetical protein